MYTYTYTYVIHILNICRCRSPCPHAGVYEGSKTNLPFTLLGCIGILFITMIAIMFVASSLPPGLAYTAQADYFMNWGLERLFNIDTHSAISLIMPAQVAMAFGFIPTGARLLASLAEAKLIPTILSSTKSSVIVVCITAYILSIVSYYNETLNDFIGNIALLSSFVSYFRYVIIKYSIVYIQEYTTRSIGL